MVVVVINIVKKSTYDKERRVCKIKMTSNRKEMKKHIKLKYILLVKIEVIIVLLLMVK